MPKAVQMQLQMPFFKVSRPFLGPIKMSEVRIPQLSLNFFIDFFFSSLVYLKPQCVLSAEILLGKKSRNHQLWPPCFNLSFFFFSGPALLNKKSSSESIEQWLHADRGSLISWGEKKMRRVRKEELRESITSLHWHFSKSSSADFHLLSEYSSFI